jgi:pyruvate dehydrogenase E2 component (dihydrolipoamide acetyltransferase)
MTLKNLVMPQAGQDLEVGKVLEWYKQVGDRVRKGESVALVETEKITLDIESPIEGYLREIVVPADTEAAILSTIGVVATDDEPPA